MYLDVAQVQTCTLRQLWKTLFPPLSKLHLPVLSVSFTQSKNMGLILDLLLPLVPTSKSIISGIGSKSPRGVMWEGLFYIPRLSHLDY